ncbi:hypothetical protein MRX96_054976 [Rhipicephalus microplus]
MTTQLGGLRIGASVDITRTDGRYRLSGLVERKVDSINVVIELNQHGNSVQTSSQISANQNPFAISCSVLDHFEAMEDQPAAQRNLAH